MDGGSLGAKLGSPVFVGLKLGWFDGAAEVEGCTDGIDVGCVDKLGTLDGIGVGI